MKLKITANHCPDEVRQVVEFAARSVGVKHSGWTVWVKNCRRGKARGRCYHDIRHITMGIGPAHNFPCDNWRSRQKFTYTDWREALMDIAAHEFAHALMHNESRRQSESEANWHGWKAITDWRNSAPPTCAT